MRVSDNGDDEKFRATSIQNNVLIMTELTLFLIAGKAVRGGGEQKIWINPDEGGGERFKGDYINRGV